MKGNCLVGLWEMPWRSELLRKEELKKGGFMNSGWRF